jgi:hypothetical protein
VRFDDKMSLEDTSPRIATALDSIGRRWPDLTTSDDEPVFVLSAGWRSGSTLLQRLLMPCVFMWGEPFGHSAMIEALARPLAAFSDTWPPPEFFYAGEAREALSEQFIASLYPGPQALVDAHLAFFEQLFAEPARRAAGAHAIEREKTRWGFKEVRLSADHAAYLKWLYPRAKIIFLVRNPWDAYRSYAARAKRGTQWYARWPDQPLTPATFAQHWRILAAGFLEQAERLGALVIRYEALSSGDYRAIEDYLGFELHYGAAEINPEARGPRPVEDLSERELDELRAGLGIVPQQLGYRPPEAPALVVDAPGDSIPREKCVVLVPAMSGIEPRCDEALRALESRGYSVRRLHGSSQIDMARSQMASNALRDGFEETLWIDSDMVFEPDDVDRLRSHGLPIVCGIYRKKGPRALSCHAMPGAEQIVFGEQGRLTEILYAATGFLLVRKQVYIDMQHQLGLPWCNERFGPPMVPYFMPLVKCDGVGRWYMSEDYSFCERARQCGYRIWADTTIRLKQPPPEKVRFSA